MSEELSAWLKRNFDAQLPASDESNLRLFDGHPLCCKDCYGWAFSALSR